MVTAVALGACQAASLIPEPAAITLPSVLELLDCRSVAMSSKQTGQQTIPSFSRPRWSLAQIFLCCCLTAVIPSLSADDPLVTTWPQWRGPSRTGIIDGNPWPAKVSGGALRERWQVSLPPSYSGPVVSPTTVFVTGTVDEQTEVVIALDRSSGKEIWRAQWPGALKVPFFAASNGSWIRATPVLDGDHLYVAGIRDVLVALNASTGAEEWRIDFVTELGSPLPAFGFVSSPLVDGDSIYVQAGASVLRLNKTSGKIIWRSLEDSGGMMGSAFSSPVMADLGGRRQLIVQTREKLAGLDPETGSLLWEQVVPSFRGMNILTPVVHDQGIFTSSYQNKSWLYAVAETANGFQVNEAWSNNAQGYMSTPIVINDHAYLHLQNERFTCIDLRTGQRTWTSETFGKYCSLVAQHDRILALD
ncbi:MAG: PQQ-like beta-propeller repeat protein, partial [Planctomycetaceae bacterium]|nr:PQQ-like beta-propeller repeat protein [Planctomycetaceae bacterium]